MSTRPELRSRYSSRSNSLSGSVTAAPRTITVCRSMSIRTGPDSRTPISSTGSASDSAPRRSTALMRAMSSRAE